MNRDDIAMFLQETAIKFANTTEDGQCIVMASPIVYSCFGVDSPKELNTNNNHVRFYTCGLDSNVFVYDCNRGKRWECTFDSSKIYFFTSDDSINTPVYKQTGKPFLQYDVDYILGMFDGAEETLSEDKITILL